MKLLSKIFHIHLKITMYVHKKETKFFWTFSRKLIY